ncbi:MAG: hypothetical protein AAB766_04230 [Patescibacteria group bacterium]
MVKLMLDDHKSSSIVGRKIIFDVFEDRIRLKKLLKRRPRKGKRSIGKLVLWVEFSKAEAMRIRRFLDRALEEM